MLEKILNKVNDLDLQNRFYLAGVKMDYLKLSTCIIKPRPGENEIGLKAYKSKPDDYLKNMNLNNKRNLSNKEIKNKTYKDTYFKWSKIIDSNLKSLNILDSDLGESIFINMNVSDVKIEKVLCWNSNFSNCTFENLNTKNFDSRDNEFYDCTFRNNVFDFSCLRGSIMENCKFENIKFTQTDLKKIKFKNCSMKMLILHTMKLPGAEI